MQVKLALYNIQCYTSCSVTRIDNNSPRSNQDDSAKTSWQDQEESQHVFWQFTVIFYHLYSFCVLRRNWRQLRKWRRQSRHCSLCIRLPVDCLQTDKNKLSPRRFWSTRLAKSTDVLRLPSYQYLIRARSLPPNEFMFAHKYQPNATEMQRTFCKCVNSTPLISAVIGGAASPISSNVATISCVDRIPQISYSSTSALLSNKQVSIPRSYGSSHPICIKLKPSQISYKALGGITFLLLLPTTPTGEAAWMRCV